MTTISHQESKDSTLMPIEDWLSLLVLLQKLQERLAEDRQSWAATGGDMVLLVEVLRIELQHLQKLGSQVEQDVKQSLQTFREQMIEVQAASMRHQLTPPGSNSFENTIQRLDKATQQAVNQLHYSQNYIQQFNGWVLVLAIMLCVLSSISGGYIVHLFDPPDQLSADQWQLIQDGTILRKAWPGLNKTEQDKIMALFHGEEIKPHNNHKNPIKNSSKAR